MIKSSYDYAYIICLWPGYSLRMPNVLLHLEFLKAYKYAQTKKILYIISVHGGQPECVDLVQQLLECTSCPPNIDIQIIQNKNWGMLQGALWFGYKFLKDNNINAQYVMAMPDDWRFNHWPLREQLLEQYDYVGMFSSCGFGDPNTAHNYRRFVKQGFKDVLQDPEDNGVVRMLGILHADRRRWTDGGLYVFKYKTLLEVEKKIGIFSKAQGECDFGEHGITFGEVGFPTEIYAAGFRFTAILPIDYEDNNHHWVSPSFSCGQGHLDTYFIKDDITPFLIMYPPKQ
jgi:hypothetical protein